MPYPTRKIGTRTIVVDIPDDEADGGVGLYARVSFSDQRGDLDRQTSRLCGWAVRNDMKVIRTVAEVGSGMNGARPKLCKMLSDPAVRTVVVERRDRLGCMNTELVEAALAAHGRKLVVVDDNELDDDLVRDMTEVLTSFCARLYGRRSARNRALRAVECAEHYDEVAE